MRLLQALWLLVACPLLYQANSWMPWATGLFVRKDRACRARFLASIQALHVIATATATAFWFSSGGTTQALRLHVPGAAISLLLLGLAGWLLAAHGPVAGKTPTRAADGAVPTQSVIDLLMPLTAVERRAFVAMSLLAGFSEELLYRGIAPALLTGLGLHQTFAVALSALAFAGIHGRAAFSPAGLYWFFKGLVYGGLVVWSDSLLLVIVLHTTWDLALLLRPVPASVRMPLHP